MLWHRGESHRLACLARLAFGLALAAIPPHPAAAAEPGAFETPPVLRAGDLVAPERLRGDSYRIEDAVPTDGFLLRFTIVSDYGTFEARGPGMLDIRLGEIRALRELDRMSHSEVFASALKDSAQQTGAALARAAQNPKETLQGMPEGVGRFFDRSRRAVQTGVQKVEEKHAARKAAGQSFDAAAAQEAGARTARVTADVMGLDEQRRKLAKQLGVDPYTTNPVLSAKLDEIAGAAFAGSLGVKVATSFVPGSMLINTTRRVSDWVWDTPPGDLRVAIDRGLQGMGVPPETVDRFLRHPSYTLTLQAALYSALAGMDGVEGRTAVTPWALQADSEDEARFAVLSVLMLARYRAEVAPVARIELPGPLAARTRDGRLAVLGPVDYVAWTARVSRLARRPDLAAAERSIWIAGRASPRAAAELAALGWKLHTDSLVVGLGPGAR